MMGMLIGLTYGGIFVSGAFSAVCGHSCEKKLGVLVKTQKLFSGSAADGEFRVCALPCELV